MSYRPNCGNRGRGGYGGGRGVGHSTARGQGDLPRGGGGGGYRGNPRGSSNPGRRGSGRGQGGSALSKVRFTKPAATQDSDKKNILEAIASDTRFRVTLKDDNTACDRLNKLKNLDQHLFKKPETLLSPAQMAAQS